MVSQLSARLLYGANSVSSYAKEAPSNQSQAGSSSIKTSSSSSDSVFSPMKPVVFNKELAPRKREPTQALDRPRKRQNVEEQDYDASVARRVLENAGVTVPVPSSAKFPNVSLLSSKKVGSGLFSAPNFASIDQYNDMEMLHSMVTSCAYHYKPVEVAYITDQERLSTPTAAPIALPEAPQSVVSCDSSPSDDDGDACESVGPDDELVAAAAECAELFGEDFGVHQEDETEKSRSSFPVNTTFAAARQPRLVIESMSPYNIIHINPTFEAFSSLPSSKVLGRPICEVLEEDDSLVRLLNAAPDNISTPIIHMQAFKSRKTRSYQTKCKVTVSPIIGQTQSLTHFEVHIKMINEPRGGSTKMNLPTMVPAVVMG